MSVALAPDPTPTGYAVGLYLEHLEEASFLYDQRLALLVDPEITWRDLTEFEGRLEAHLDALAVGGEVAIEVCRDHAPDADAGELHATTRLFCRSDRLDAFVEMLGVVDAADARSVDGVISGLEQELPDRWLMELLRSFGSGDDLFDRVVARAIGYRRLVAGPALTAVLAKSGAVVDIVWALGRLREIKSYPMLRTLMQKHDDGEVRATAAVALARMGDLEALNECQKQIFSQHWPRFVLGLAGGRSSVRALLGAITANLDHEGILALGVLGDVSAIPTLIGLLRNDQVAADAATALHLITGAGIRESVFVPEAVDPDERDGTVPPGTERTPEGREEAGAEPGAGGKPAQPKDDGEVAGEMVRRLAQDPSKWSAWWGNHQSRFDPSMRYRHGMPYSPVVLVEILADEGSPREVRDIVSEELVIRYSTDLSFEGDLPAQIQLLVIERYREWAAARATQFQPGAWYFAGKLLA